MGKGIITKYSIDKVFQSMDIVEVIGDFVELKKTGCNYSGLSPITDERTPSFKVSPSKGVWKDFSSGKGGKDAISYLTKICNMSYPEAIEYVANKYAISLEYEDGNTIAPKNNEPIIHKPKKHIEYSFHNPLLIRQYGRGFKDNDFVQYLKKYFPRILIEGAILNYRLGTTTHIKGATIFWYVDSAERVTYGKIMQYDRETGSSKDIEGKPLGISSMKTILGLKDFNKKPNLFGAHLINDRTDFYGIVESEKTAVIMSMIDTRLTWLATGGAGNLSLELLAPLGNKNIILFPDAAGKNNEAFENWKELSIKSKGLGYKITCSTLLNDLYGHLGKGHDLADHYLNGEGTKERAVNIPKEPKKEIPITILSPEESICNDLNKRNGNLKKLIDAFELTLSNGEKPRILDISPC